MTHLYVNSSNDVIARGDWRNDYTNVCNTAGNNSVNIQTCALWMSILSTSLTNDKKVLLQYDDKGGTFNCSTITTYGASPTPGYVMLIK